MSNDHAKIAHVRSAWLREVLNNLVLTETQGMSK